MGDIDSNLPVRAASGDVVVNLLDINGATMNPASEGTSLDILAGLTGLADSVATETTLQSVLAGVTGIEAIVATESTQLSVLAGVTAIEAAQASVLAGVTGIEAIVATEATQLNVLAGVTAIEGKVATEATQLSVLAGVTGIEAKVATEATQLSVLAGVTAIEALDTSILAGVTGVRADLARQLPEALGSTGSAASLSVVMAKDQTPVPVYVTSQVAGTNVTQFKTDASVATAGTSVNTYAPASTFILDRVHASGSGRIKVEVREALVAGITGPDALKWVAFNSSSDPNVDIDCSQYKVVAGEEVQVVVTNLETGKAQDLYSTIVGDLL